MIYIILLFSKSKEHASPSIDNNEAVIQCNHIIIPLDTDNAIYKLDEMTETFPLQNAYRKQESEVSTFVFVCFDFS